MLGTNVVSDGTPGGVVMAAAAAAAAAAEAKRKRDALDLVRRGCVILFRVWFGVVLFFPLLFFSPHRPRCLFQVSDGSDDDDSLNGDVRALGAARSFFPLFFSHLRLQGKGLSKADKRAHHNALERKRRDHIKDSFSVLRDAIPALTGDKVRWWVFSPPFVGCFSRLPGL